MLRIQLIESKYIRRYIQQKYYRFNQTIYWTLQESEYSQQDDYFNPVNWNDNNSWIIAIKKSREKSKNTTFILVHPSTRATSNPLPNQQRFPLKWSKISFTPLLPASYTLLPAVPTTPNSKPTTLNPSAGVTPEQKPTALPNYSPVIEYSKNHTIHNTKWIEIKCGRLSSGPEPKQLILTQVVLQDSWSL